MKKIFFFFAFLFFIFQLHAQYTLRLVVTDVATKKLDDIYVAGSFNNWNPKDANYKLKPFGGSRKAIVLKDIPAGTYQFKFTRGNWDKVETTAKGENVENRTVEVNGDVSENITIAGWKDDFPDKPKPNTATAQVHVIDTAFFIPQLNRHRRIWIYLPKSYNTTKGKLYPVLYMMDGQNLFNEQTAAFGEWGVDECLDTLQQKTGKECIVVGVDNDTVKRVNEYDPYDNEKYGKGEGKQFADFLANTLKPFVDKQYQTLKDVKHTYIAGSSMGGLISLYAVMEYPQTFGAVGVFSPAFWIAPQMFTDMQQTTWTTFPRFYFYAGGKETETMVSDMKKMYNVIAQKHNYDMQEVVYPLGQHNESYWRKEFPNFYKWLVK